jgi:hypothetical protein
VKAIESKSPSALSRYMSENLCFSLFDYGIYLPKAERGLETVSYGVPIDSSNGFGGTLTAPVTLKYSPATRCQLNDHVKHGAGTISEHTALKY